MNTRLHSIGQPLLRLQNLAKLFCAAALLSGAASAARASNPNGIYAFVDRVVFEPDDARPERILVWGGFALAKGNKGDDYHDAGRGYMYFKLRSGEEDICRKEWADLKAVAGTGQIVTFGTRYERTPPALRKAGVKIENPDVYPRSWGMSKVKQGNYPPVLQLNKLQGQKSDAGGPSKSPGK